MYIYFSCKINDSGSLMNLACFLGKLEFVENRKKIIEKVQRKEFE